ncbi:hypothetical protein ASG06_05035 [Rathayibacter sp. Leaf185]|nr:hypothetical protein ASF42_05025 [Rathayibacter sp. Leaf294]KQS13761.1 hypothetical protein ASG06_05035 [Rathayibacter sp. Leaf185]
MLLRAGREVHLWVEGATRVVEDVSVVGEMLRESEALSRRAALTDTDDHADVSTAVSEVSELRDHPAKSGTFCPGDDDVEAIRVAVQDVLDEVEQVGLALRGLADESCFHVLSLLPRALARGRRTGRICFRY